MGILSDVSLYLLAAAFLGAAAVIAVAGVRLAGVADGLAARTGLGETIMRAVFVGASTSLPGVVTSVSAAAQGYPVLAVSNAVGGIAAQTAFLGIADLAYRKANLEHAAASVANLMQGTLLVALLAITLVAMALPDWALLGVGVASPVLVAAYLFGLRLLWSSRRHPMWSPRRTRETQVEEEEAPPARPSLARLWITFALLAAVTGAAGFVVGEAGMTLVDRTGLSETAVGGLFTAISTSLPELVTAVAAVRRGALNLAVGNILGGNCFDVLFLALADAAYREGAIYQQFTERTVLVIALTMLMTATLLMGLLRREKFTYGRIGFESAFVLAMYAGGAVAMFA